MPTLPQWAVDYSAGLGDELLVGQGQWLRNLAGVDSGVNRCSSSYSAGKWTGFAALLAAGGLAGAEAAGTKTAAAEFSHWLPARFFNPNSPSYKPALDKALGWAEGTILNGNFVTKARHYLHDPFRYPRGWRDLGEKWPNWLQQLDRIPNLFKGVAGGATAGGVGLTDACTCSQ
jgi:hypothetical protein